MKRFFRKPDLIVYAALVLLILVCFLSANSSSEALEGIEIYVQGKLCYSYSFVTRQEVVYDSAIISPEHSGDSILVDIYTEGHNRLLIQDGKAKMISADCSASMDCVKKFGEIAKPNDIIVCAVHSIIVVGSGTSSSLPSG